MKQLASLVLGVSVAVAGCTKAKPVVIPDGWWSADFAKETCTQANEWHRENAPLIAQVGCSAVTACPEMIRRVEACATDVVQSVREFETELATQLAADPACSTVSFARFNGPDDADQAAADAMQGPHWSLMLFFEPGAARQSWSMLRSPDQNAFTKGEGDPKEIARTVCSIIKERGAQLLN
jgi:hypothetical protein